MSLAKKLRNIAILGAVGAGGFFLGKYTERTSLEKSLYYYDTVRLHNLTLRIKKRWKPPKDTYDSYDKFSGYERIDSPGQPTIFIRKKKK